MNLAEFPYQDHMAQIQEMEEEMSTMKKEMGELTGKLESQDAFIKQHLDRQWGMVNRLGNQVRESLKAYTDFVQATQPVVERMINALREVEGVQVETTMVSPSCQPNHPSMVPASSSPQSAPRYSVRTETPPRASQTPTPPTISLPLPLPRPSTPTAEETPALPNVIQPPIPTCTVPISAPVANTPTPQEVHPVIVTLETEQSSMSNDIPPENMQVCAISSPLSSASSKLDTVQRTEPTAEDGPADQVVAEPSVPPMEGTSTEPSEEDQYADPPVAQDGSPSKKRGRKAAATGGSEKKAKRK
jgi:hypothetical protein